MVQKSLQVNLTVHDIPGAVKEIKTQTLEAVLAVAERDKAVIGQDAYNAILTAVDEVGDSL